jgi:hypothetical protein
MLSLSKCLRCNNTKPDTSLYQCGTPDCGTLYCYSCADKSITFYNPRRQENQTWRGGGCPKCSKSLAMSLGTGGATQNSCYESEGHYCFKDSGNIPWD